MKDEFYLDQMIPEIILHLESWLSGEEEEFYIGF